MQKFHQQFITKTLIFLLLVGYSNNLIAKKGMWMPPLLNKQEVEMAAMGLQIPANQLYNDDGTGLNNAIVLFGRGCTGEIISSNGLVLTNHHCGYGTVQGLSSKENDYFADGFWAKNNKEELHCGGLTVTFIRKMENVTDKIVIGLEDTLSQKKRDSIISIRIKNLEKGYKYTTGMDALIKSYYYGNEYWVILTEKFTDIRLVGFPPNGIGAFGGDTDNWMWPRHTGDFSLFRIYAGPDNKPADYSKDNKPYQPKRYLTINTGGYKEGDFTMVYGFPGTTQQYISSYQLNQVFNTIDPIRIEVRTKLLETWGARMDASRDVFLKYTSKHKRVANGWKKWQGEVRGLRLNNVTEKKKGYEQQFQGWASTDETLPYADDLLSKMGAISIAVNDIIAANEYIREAVLSIEIIRQASVLERILEVHRSGVPSDERKKIIDELTAKMSGFYKNYDVATDQDVFKALLPLFFDKTPKYVPELFTDQYVRHGASFDKWANFVYNSAITSQDKLNNLATADSNAIKADPAYQLYDAINTVRTQQVLPALSVYNDKMSYLNRLYMKAQKEFDKTTNFFPDANLSLRLTYGRVKGIDPDGDAGYSFQTNLDEAVAKHKPDVEEFNMPEKLRTIQQENNYGRWAVDGTVPIGFIATNHTTGGNSGSPVLNSKGELIGLNFDRIWEGTMSDLYFDPKLCRNISVDIRYVLFIIDKFGDAGWLLQEMRLKE